MILAYGREFLIKTIFQCIWTILKGHVFTHKLSYIKEKQERIFYFPPLPFTRYNTCLSGLSLVLILCLNGKIFPVSPIFPYPQKYPLKLNCAGKQLMRNFCGIYSSWFVVIYSILFLFIYFSEIKLKLKKGKKMRVMTHANFAQEKSIPILRQSQQDLTLLIWMKMVLDNFLFKISYNLRMWDKRDVRLDYINCQFM